MPSPSDILRLACFAFLPLTAVARSVGPYMEPRGNGYTMGGLIRPDLWSFSVNCSFSAPETNGTELYGHVNGLLDGFHYLMNRGDDPKNSPKSCGRISCAHDTAIYWCNNDPLNSKQLGSYGDVARVALEIFKQKSCWQNPDDDNYMEAGIKGEAFVDGDNWSVRVIPEKCTV